jgi:hypothetical protein
MAYLEREYEYSDMAIIFVDEIATCSKTHCSRATGEACK